jgi:hypothetical protein
VILPRRAWHFNREAYLETARARVVISRHSAYQMITLTREAICPTCHSPVGSRYEFRVPFPCAACGRELVVEDQYRNRFHVIVLTITLAVSILLWMGNYYLIFLIPFAGVLVFMVVFSFMKRIFPPPLIDVQTSVSVVT